MGTNWKLLLALLSFTFLLLAEQPFDYPLNGIISVEEKTLTQKRDNVTIYAYLENTDPINYSIQLYYENDGQWSLLREIGELEPYGALNATIVLHLTYEGYMKKISHYALIAASPLSVKGKEFEVVEDWTGYRDQVSEYLSGVSLSVIPIIVIFILILLAVVVAYAQKRHETGFAEGEFTNTSLFFPRMAGRPFEEKIADLFITPFFWSVELISLIVLIWILLLSYTEKMGDTGIIPVFLIAGAGAFMMPLFYLIVVYYAESYTQKPLRFFIGLFVWGMYSAFFALLLNSSIELQSLLFYIPVGYTLTITAILIAPLIEETLKGLGVYFVSGHHEYDSMFTGLLFGFTAGVGFSFVENWFYFTSKSSPFDYGVAPWVGLMLYRSFFNSLGHGCFTAATGALIGYFKSHKNYSQFAKFGIIPGIFIAVMLHSIFNMSAIADQTVINNNFPIFIFNPASLLVLAVLFIAAFAYSKSEADKMRAQVAHPLQNHRKA
jgi:RsiW-degrading membrane proteinase PrsW (M82 family)